MKEYKEIISIDPLIRFGKPCIKGTRISVQDVLDWYSSGMSTEEILKDFPEINTAQIKACLDYAADKAHKIHIG